ncbi:unnamed protein product [Allacma fusca]|uniref:Secreted protein n=1 Tax=Allacma fusca TaxID=39272 RepID=A0A8J2PQS8_9HEXA|nr:unnamed protein product [Allacma fusca]
MLSFAKYFCTLSICNLLLLHGILSAPTDSEESVLEEKQRCQSGYCWNSYQNQCVPCGGGGGGGHNCPYGQHWNGYQCVSGGNGK